MKNKNKNRSLFFLFFLLMAGFFGVGKGVLASNNCANHIIISEIYGGGGNSGAAYKNDFIELYNPTNTTIDLSNWSVQYTSVTGTFTTKITILSKAIYSKGYYLIAEEKGNGGTDELPIPDAVGNIGLAATAGKIALVKKDQPISGIADKDVVDFVGYGNKASEYEANPAPAPSNNTKSITRNNACIDTNDNSADFNNSNAPTPQNSLWEEPEPIIYSNKIRVNELLPKPAVSEEEFVELYNFDDEEIDLAGWKLKDKGGNICNLTNKKMNPGEYWAIKESAFASGCNIALNDSDGEEIFLYNPQDKESVSSAKYSENAKENQSYSFNGENWQWTSQATPGANNKFDLIKPPAENLNYSNEIILNEILPNSSEEYIELYNPGEKNENLSDWILRDGSKTGKYTFPENSVIKSTGYLTIYKKDFKFALNNSGSESVTLSNPLGNEVSKLNYSGSAKKDVSYNFDGATWRWSKFLTPGAENIFNNLPSVSTKKKNKIYAGVYAEFSAKGKDADKDKLKYAWDFGDGHKSYLKNTRHKYEKSGKYEVKLKVSDGSEDKIKSFKVEVKKFPKNKIEITSVSPNPEGKDSETEYILVKNTSKKKINLKDWGVATGSKKLYNHPISKDLVIKPGETKKIARDVSSFTLNNKKAKIEIRYPDGKVAAKVKYEKDKSPVSEGELYAKVDKRWRWIAAKPAAVKNSIAATPAIPQENSALASATPQVPLLPPILKISAAEIQNSLGKISKNKPESENKFVLAYTPELPAPKNISFSPREKINFLLGISTVHAEGDSYHFTDNSTYQPPDHYAVKFLKNVLTSINSLLHKLILKLEI